jgi:bifunctional ADP-heptose synthase (sugar kinase/adenylyltransferase)
VEFTLRFPEVSATAHSIMDVVTAGDTYEVTMAITVHDGAKLIAEHHWQRSFPRA